MPQLTAFVQQSSRTDFERRCAERHATDWEALSRPLDATNGISWGAVIRDISTTGIGLSICYPFRAGTYLAVDIHDPAGLSRSLLVRVVHALDQSDGTWHVGCEFVKPICEDELEMLV